MRTDDQTNKCYHLYKNNPAVYPSDNQYADGYIRDSWGEDDVSHTLDEIAEAAKEVTDNYRFDTSTVHLWRADCDQGYDFKMPDSYWKDRGNNGR